MKVATFTWPPTDQQLAVAGVAAPPLAGHDSRSLSDAVQLERREEQNRSQTGGLPVAAAGSAEVGCLLPLASVASIPACDWMGDWSG